MGILLRLFCVLGIVLVVGEAVKGQSKPTETAISQRLAGTWISRETIVWAESLKAKWRVMFEPSGSILAKDITFMAQPDTTEPVVIDLGTFSVVDESHAKASFERDGKKMEFVFELGQDGLLRTSWKGTPMTLQRETTQPLPAPNPKAPAVSATSLSPPAQARPEREMPEREIPKLESIQRSRVVTNTDGTMTRTDSSLGKAAPTNNVSEPLTPTLERAKLGSSTKEPPHSSMPTDNMTYLIAGIAVGVTIILVVIFWLRKGAP